MPVSGITLLIIMFLAGNPEPVFMVENLPKETRAYVHDKKRKEEILLLYKQYEKEVKPFKKEFTKTRKKLKKLNLSKKTSEDSLLQLLSHSLDIQERIAITGISYRMQIQELFLSGEWDAIFTHKEYSSDDSIRKNSGQDLDTELEEIELIITKYISDPFRATEILKAHHRYSKRLKELIEINADTVKHNLLVFCRQDAERDELEKALSSTYALDDDVFFALLDFNDVLKDYTTNEEWFQIIKKINRRY